MTSQFFFFFSSVDESSFSVELLKRRPNVRFVEDLIEGSTLHRDLRHCSDKWVYVFDFFEEEHPIGDNYSEPMRKKNPHSIVMIERCTTENGVMRSGTVKFGTSEEELNLKADVDFYKEVKRAAQKLKKTTICYFKFPPLEALEEKVFPAYIVGGGAQKWLLEENTNVLRNRSVEIFYLTRECIHWRNAKFERQ